MVQSQFWGYLTFLLSLGLSNGNRLEHGFSVQTPPKSSISVFFDGVCTCQIGQKAVFLLKPNYYIYVRPESYKCAAADVRHQKTILLGFWCQALDPKPEPDTGNA